MYIRYTKEISKEEAKRIKEAKKILDSMDKIKDAEFLCKDYSLFKNMPKKNSFFLKKDLAIKLKPSLQPEYEMFDRFGSDIYQVYQEVFGEKIKSKLYFICGKYGGFDEAAIQICSMDGRGSDFYLGGFIPAQLNFMTGTRNNLKVINSIARYFFNRAATYHEIYNILVKNEKKFNCIVGETFIKDMISIFSVEEMPEIQAFNISPQNLKIQILGRKVKRKKDFFIGTAFYQLEKETAKYARLNEIKIELWLNKESRLIINAIPKEQYYQSSLIKMQELEKNSDFKDFIDIKINNWLKAIVTEANFANKLYSKIKTKILLGNI